MSFLSPTQTIMYLPQVMQACSLIYLGVIGKLTLNEYTKLINETQDQLVLIGKFDIILNFAGFLLSLGCNVFGLLTGSI